jgi:hypothetical protein
VKTRTAILMLAIALWFGWAIAQGQTGACVCGSETSLMFCPCDHLPVAAEPAAKKKTATDKALEVCANHAISFNYGACGRIVLTTPFGQDTSSFPAGYEPGYETCMDIKRAVYDREQKEKEAAEKKQAEADAPVLKAALHELGIKPKPAPNPNSLCDGGVVNPPEPCK